MSLCGSLSVGGPGVGVPVSATGSRAEVSKEEVDEGEDKGKNLKDNQGDYDEGSIDTSK